MRLSIRYKILGVLGILLLAAVCFYTLLASAIFKEEKIALLYDLNHSIAANTAAQVRSSLERVGDELKLYALSNILSKTSELRLPARHLQEAHIVSAGLFLKDGDTYEEVKLPADISPTRIELPRILPHLKEAADTHYAFWDQTSQEQTPRFFLATRLEIMAGSDTKIYVAVAELESKPFFETLQAANLFQSYLVNRDGEVFVHCDRTSVTAAKPIKDHPLVQALRSRGTTSGVLSFAYGGQRWYGAYAPVEIGGLYFLSQASRSQVTAALSTLVKRSLLFGLIVITITFIASILFSKRLTRNLQALTLGAQAIGEGNLSSQIKIQSGDEVETLAVSFNAMADALRSSREAIERYNRELEDKVALRTQQLQETNATIKEVQEKLLRTTQLAAVGEVAGRTAHELLNPLTAIMGRVERSRVMFAGAGGASVPAQAALPGQLAEILTAWESDFRSGGMAQLTQSLQGKSQVRPELTLLEEDLDNLKKLAAFWQQQTQVVANDLEFVRDQAQRIHRIIDRMRELVRSSVKAEVHCHEALDEALQTMNDFMAKHGIVLDRQFTATEDLAVLNRDELIQITTNLLRNSLQAIESRGDSGKIGVRTESHGHLLSVDVVDNGVGIPEEKRRFIFEQGFTTKSPSEGTGLGLAICRRYAHAFGGEVELLYSEPGGRGTCFRITIPLKDAGAAAKIAS